MPYPSNRPASTNHQRLSRTAQYRDASDLPVSDPMILACKDGSSRTFRTSPCSPLRRGPCGAGSACQRPSSDSTSAGVPALTHGVRARQRPDRDQPPTAGGPTLTLQGHRRTTARVPALTLCSHWRSATARITPRERHNVRGRHDRCKRSGGQHHDQQCHDEHQTYPSCYPPPLSVCCPR